MHSRAFCCRRWCCYRFIDQLLKSCTNQDKLKTTQANLNYLLHFAKIFQVLLRILLSVNCTILWPQALFIYSLSLGDDEIYQPFLTYNLYLLTTYISYWYIYVKSWKKHCKRWIKKRKKRVWFWNNVKVIFFQQKNKMLFWFWVIKQHLIFKNQTCSCSVIHSFAHLSKIKGWLN